MISQKKKNGPLIAFLVVFVLAIMTGTIFYNSHPSQSAIAATYDIPATVKIDGTILPQGKTITPFQLTDNKNQTYTEKSFKNHWNLVFFGFTNCGYVCPTTLAALNQMYQKLEKDLPNNQLPQVVFVSVDPERDTVARVNQFVTSYNPHFIGLRGAMADTRLLANEMAATFVKVQLNHGKKDQYMINHSANIMLVDPAGNLRAFFSFPHTGPQMAKDYENILSSEHQHSYV